MALRRTFKNQKGFSLLEILIVMAIMGAIAVIASQAIRGGLQTKKKLDARLKTESMVFDALRLMATDIERAFHYQYALYEIDRSSVAAQQQGNNPNEAAGTPPTQSPNSNQAQPPPPPVQLTNFIGKESSVHFTTLNHYRTTANAQESNEVEVGYYLDDCKSYVTGKSSTCLWRRESIVVDNDVTRGGDATPLLENVSNFKLEYIGETPSEKDWKKEWLTDNNGTTNTQNRFPALVKIALTIEDKNNKDFAKFSQSIIASVRFTNNVDPAKKFQGSGANTAPNSGAGGNNNPLGNGGSN
ncbi:MAG: prepilin-type N-terminal cleavage/methylation domain-containing protein [Bdellovibrionaceae bacterium]|nr:prepilin-type N-terminal cleavage/methylation domain-containing protein [Pseudobdellovibrionaceae bacterium]